MKKGLILLFLLFIPVVCYANPDYTIDKYKIDIDINNNDYIVKENIEVSFHKIVTNMKMTLPYDIKDLKINTEYDTVTSDNRIITISNDKKANSSYEVSYLLPSNSEGNSYNIEIANNYDGIIKETEFVVNLPSSVTKENIKFYYEDEDVTKDIEYKLEGNKVVGSYKKALLNGDKLVLNVKYNKVYINGFNLLVIVLPIILSIISYYIWYMYGKDLKVNIVKSFSLPKDLTPLDIALVKNEKVVNDDVFAFLIYMANKGYIKIVEEKNNEFYLERVKDYDGDNYQEEVFIKALFRKTMKITLAEYIDLVSEKKQIEKEEKLEKKVASTDLVYCYKRALTNLLPAINNDEEKATYYELESDRKKNILIFFVAAILVFITLVPFVEINKLYLFPFSIIYSVIALKILLMLVNSINIDDERNKNKKIYMLLLSILVIMICVIVLIPSFRRNLIYSLAFIISFISVVFILILYKYMPKRTLYGSKVFAKIEGLKIFVDTCDKSDLEIALKKNKDYLYDLLAYSYILGKTSKVFSLMKNSNIKEPKWYKLKDEFTVVKFYNSLNRLKSNLMKELS